MSKLVGIVDLQTLLQRCCDTLSPTCIAMHHMPTAVRSILFHTYVTLIQTVYRALLTSAVSGTGHRIHTPKKCSADLLHYA